ncbi:MAG: GNAT family N-acetyltransferase [Candidatus Hydrogenedentes bacterium]|nr:GNAT family N-acetyltransferase [Candidatus Hydrogenedentota bacterium]
MPQLKMEKHGLDGLPVVPLPEGYTLRHFQPGDEEALARIYGESELGSSTVEAVRRNVLTHPCFKPERIQVIEFQGQPVGTAAAWIEHTEPDVGYLHMVGVLSEHRGKRLGRILTLAALQYTREEGFDVQRLVTDDWRDSALRLYLDLGYDPILVNPTFRVRWEAIARRLNRPDIMERMRVLPVPPARPGLLTRLLRLLGFARVASS